ncbi:MAG: helix-turn-helix domain-containing protein [Planctomycetes bacterium]|nr:helix-turn-helix domain-containing protein [Planctomycetota bacterium]
MAQRPTKFGIDAARKRNLAGKRARQPKGLFFLGSKVLMRCPPPAGMRSSRWLAAKAVFYFLEDRVRVGGGGRCNPSEETIARNVGVSVDTVQEGLKLLSRHGWVSVYRMGRGAQNEYELHLPPSALAAYGSAWIESAEAARAAAVVRPPATPASIAAAHSAPTHAHVAGMDAPAAEAIASHAPAPAAPPHAASTATAPLPTASGDEVSRVMAQLDQVVAASYPGATANNLPRASGARRAVARLIAEHGAAQVVRMAEVLVREWPKKHGPGKAWFTGGDVPGVAEIARYRQDLAHLVVSGGHVGSRKADHYDAAAAARVPSLDAL